MRRYLGYTALVFAGLSWVIAMTILELNVFLIAIMFALTGVILLSKK